MKRVAGLLLALGATAAAAAGEQPVVVGSKPFAESLVLAETFAQLLEADGFAVERRLGLGSTEICFRGLVEGAVDVYPEYTGTGLVAILGVEPVGGRQATYDRVAGEFARRWSLQWLPPLGFENTYEIALRTGLAERLQLRTLSDLARVAPGLRAGLSPDFIGRADGLPGLETTYGIRFGETRSLVQAVKHGALIAGEVDVIDGYSTDGSIARHGLTVLVDDRGFFPPYEAAPLVSARLWRDQPAAIRALVQLAGRLDEDQMRRANLEVESGSAQVDEVAGRLLERLDLGVRGDRGADARRSDGSSLARLMWVTRADLVRQTTRHVQLVVVSVAAAVLVAVPLGLGLERARWLAPAVLRAVGVLQTIPSIALLAFMIPLLGIGVRPALAALFLYSLLPILRNTTSGVRSVDPVAVDTAVALGMTSRQVVLQVRLPLAVPLIMAGVRTAAVINVGTATLAAFVGAGGLGDPIVAGLALTDTNMILSGAIPAALLAVVVDLALGAAESRLRPAGQG